MRAYTRSEPRTLASSPTGLRPRRYAHTAHVVRGRTAPTQWRALQEECDERASVAGTPVEWGSDSAIERCVADVICIDGFLAQSTDIDPIAPPGVEPASKAAEGEAMPEPERTGHKRKTAVVLDTNILIAAGFNPGSHAARIVRATREGRLRMVWCEETRRESERLLRKIPPLSWRAFADLFGKDTRYTRKIDPSMHKEIPDPADRVFAALAHAAGATLITQDDHLLAHRSCAAVPYLTAHEFVRFELRDNRQTGRRHDPSRLAPETATEEETG